jgi:hypothetical protein
MGPAPARLTFEISRTFLHKSEGRVYLKLSLLREQQNFRATVDDSTYDRAHNKEDIT